ncbi:hypothetical protein [Burkholderia gladioli]|uniref:hypothetical protein n=1 Tax=Burkholderia gladioli TaxID=28095 RepID=UPI00155FBFBA|nr:hypothetical protein [Burkholderia gladioli]NRF86054.1 hypothetical protein [Burkholderia gladioli]
MVKIDERHLPELQYIANEIADMFPDGVEFHLGSPVNFFVMWPLQDQPADLTQWSRSVSIYFSDHFLDALGARSEGDRAPFIDELKSMIQPHIAGMDDGRGMRRGAVKEAICIDLTHDLTI